MSGDRWVIDDAGRMIAPPQPTIRPRPAGPWDSNAEGAAQMKLQFKVTAKQGTKILAEVVGRDGVEAAARLTVEDVVDNVAKTEQFLERLTGLRWHIEQVG